MESVGYFSAAYAQSLADFGKPLALPRSGGWLLERPIGETLLRDMMGPYPLFACQDWNGLPGDLEEIEGVSVALVADPFGEWSPDLLARCFPDRCTPFKQHFVTDVQGPSNPQLSKHHRYYARRALKALTIDIFEGPALAELTDEWTSLYSYLTSRHGLTGIKAFSASSFAAQMKVPGMTLLRAQEGGVTVGAHMWIVQNGIAYSHLAATNPQGYRALAPYALYAAAIEHFRDRVTVLNLGGAAGSNDADDGLARFKRGWSNRTIPVFFCGRILDRAAYDALARTAGGAEQSYFPAYRMGELTYAR